MQLAKDICILTFIFALVITILATILGFFAFVGGHGFTFFAYPFCASCALSFVFGLFAPAQHSF